MIHSVSLESPVAAAPTAASFQAPGLDPDAHESGLKSPAVHGSTGQIDTVAKPEYAIPSVSSSLATSAQSAPRCTYG